MPSYSKLVHGVKYDMPGWLSKQQDISSNVTLTSSDIHNMCLYIAVLFPKLQLM